MKLQIDEDELRNIIGQTPVISDGDFGLIGDKEHRQQSELHKLRQLNYLLDKYNEAKKVSGMSKWFVPGTPFSIDNCPKHKAFFDAGKDYDQRLFMAANRVGKSVSGALESAYHATGLYPEWWTGRRFEGPTSGWAIGSTAQATRDTVQRELIGPPGAWGTGILPSDTIGNMFAKQGTPQAIDFMQVRHVSGGWSEIGFKNYEQPIEAFYGTAKHWIWGDEIIPINIYNECLVRTVTTNGIIYVTFTPLTGLTPLVVKFCEDADYLAGAKRIIGLPTDDDEEDENDDGLIEKGYKAIIQAGWDDAPWLDKKQTDKILDSSEPHLRETRRTGVPSMGSGAVYPVTLDQFMVPPFEIPRHFKKLYALDVGWNRTAALWLALDPNTDTIYIYDEHYIGEQPPAVHASAILSRGNWIPGVIDPASKGRSQGDGSQLLQSYKDLGLKLTKANNDVEGGVQAVWQRLSSGKIRVFNSLHNLAKEYVLYRRDEKGRIIKDRDHLMDCFDRETEVLTEAGWKAWPSVSEEDVFATVNLDTDTIEYQKADYLVKKPYEGPMIFLDNKAQQMVTPNHRMVVYERKNKYNLTTVKLAKDLSIWDKIKVGVTNWEGSEFIPPIDDCSPEDFAEMLGWWVAEGSLNHAYPSNPHRYGVLISQVKPHTKLLLEELLNRLPQGWSCQGDSFECTHKKLYDYLKPLGLSGDKYVPDEIKKANKTIIAAFLRGYFLGDGWIQGKDVQCSASISKRLTDDIQELMFKLGRPGNIIKRPPGTWNIEGRSGVAKEQWWFVESTVKTAMLRDSKNNSNIKQVEYSGNVYCASVPNGTLVVRRNGKISVSGNCLRYGVVEINKARSIDQMVRAPVYAGPKRYNI